MSNGRPRRLVILINQYTYQAVTKIAGKRTSGHGSVVSLKKQKRDEITLSGGSLGSCVDEERSQVRELM